MTKSQIFQLYLSQNQIAPPENLESILNWIDENKSISFFSWKMFKLGKPDFDTQEAAKFIGPEKKFVDLLKRLDIKFSYIKLIPDELPEYLYAKKFPDSVEFARQVRYFFSTTLIPAKCVLMSNLLKKPGMRKMYDFVFSEVCMNFTKLIDKEKYNKEIKYRNSKSVAKKAFGLFAAESAVIYKYFKNPVLLAGQRSIDTYKYEFFKYPKNRPVLPKLFVI
ncbi:hypothetical protein A2899_00555 [Candidatus Amesbacteria bacterium RIFCSPLOWO2_01_FULL_49_25]|uniref:Uncharacterized protein n=1 Tax=Candidatus Amesbacteria bacterium RIFCSPHIGHO2_01_FULL_48_32b TaxID=1797253 RepID=A0A1F4YDQ6_9BACT|nr:MAG: hypothetical protein A2876_04000 [Candidatus Amesbacteria bacterium RIFCSPHIGHO2_01_FULL_48_32b]OGD07614.1 MAG: hypothetical protein A2899_00555 [Candidatus Amesbacteria bacterium RIFCSPLOWO2_01_FULL_49_25]